MKALIRPLFSALFLFAATHGCSDALPTETPAPSETPSETCTATELEALEQQIASTLDKAAVDTAITESPDFTLLLEGEDGRRFSHSHGASTATTSYESASTSKLVSAVVILDLVDQGLLSLDSKPHDLLPFWTGESQVTLRHLLAFTSGFHREPCANGQSSCPLSCVNQPTASFEACVQKIYETNVAGPAPAPGTRFYYASTHLQIAGLMAMTVTKKTWAQIFDTWKAKTGLFPTGAYDLPSATNPRLAGGMHWTGEEYLGLLRALFKEKRVLTEASRAELFANQRGSAAVVASPVLEANGEDWAYGFGNWLECPTAQGAGSFDCTAPGRNSTPGAYGAYPFIDFEHRHIGILARQGKAGSFREGLAIFRTVQSLVDQWAAAKRCVP